MVGFEFFSEFKSIKIDWSKLLKVDKKANTPKPTVTYLTAPLSSQRKPS